MKKRNPKMTGIIALLTSLVLIAGCGEEATSFLQDSKNLAGGAPQENYQETVAEDYGYDDYENAAAMDTAVSEEAVSGVDQAEVQNSSQKMIVTYNMDLQTEQFDEAIRSIEKEAVSYGGYIESEEISSYSYSSRYAYLTVRIPEAKADSFVKGAGNLGRITHSSTSQENVTLQYVDMESRIRSLRSEQSALMELMEDADTTADIIEIQSQLTTVNYEIESYESMLRTLQDQITYSTIHMNIQETVVTPMTEEDGFWGQASQAFVRTARATGSFFKGLAIVLIAGSPIFAAIIVIIILLVWFRKKRKARRLENGVGKRPRGRKIQIRKKQKSDAGSEQE